VPRFMDFHQDLTLPADAVAQIADDARNARADRFGVRQIELYHNPQGQVYCLLDGPDEDAIRQHHAALGVPCGDVHQVDSLALPGTKPSRRPGRLASIPVKRRIGGQSGSPTKTQSPLPGQKIAARPAAAHRPALHPLPEEPGRVLGQRHRRQDSPPPMVPVLLPSARPDPLQRDPIR
jgi:hypothetical protein